MGLLSSNMRCQWCGKNFVWSPANITMTAKYCSKKCILEAEQSSKNSKAEKASAKAAKGSFVENLTKNIEDTKKGINMIKSFFGKGKQEEPTPSMPQVQAQSNSNSSVADELKKFKELLDAGVLTQEEFDKKKKELIG